MNLILSTIVLFTLSLSAFAQKEEVEHPKEYLDLIEKAEAYYTSKEYKKAADTYTAAFKWYKWKGAPIDRFNAACSWALASVPDSAFANLERIAFRGRFSNVKRVTEDKDLVSLRTDKRWKPLVARVEKNKADKEAQRKE
jgi:hypothetical protein